MEYAILSNSRFWNNGEWRGLKWPNGVFEFIFGKRTNVSIDAEFIMYNVMKISFKVTMEFRLGGV